MNLMVKNNEPDSPDPKKNAPRGDDTPNEATIEPEHIKHNTNPLMQSTQQRNRVNRLNEKLIKPIERWMKGGMPSERYLQHLYRDPMRLLAPETCSVEGCEEEADVAPHLFKRYFVDGSQYEWGVDEHCPFLCHHHKEEDKAARRGLRSLYTDLWANWVIYRPVEQPEEVCI